MPSGITIGSIPEHIIESISLDPFLLLDRMGSADNTLTTDRSPDKLKGNGVYTGWNGVFNTLSERTELGTGGGGQEVVAIDMGQANYEILCNFYLSTEILNADGGIMFRGVDSDNYWMFVTITGQGWIIYKNALGFTADTTTAVVSTAGDIYALRITCIDNAIECYVNGSTFANVTVAATDSGTFVGMRIHSGNDGTGGSYFDDLEVRPL